MIVYYTGTGNSRYVAQRFAAALGDDLIIANEYIETTRPPTCIPTGRGCSSRRHTAGRSRTFSQISSAAAALPAAGRRILS